MGDINTYPGGSNSAVMSGSLLSYAEVTTNQNGIGVGGGAA